MELTDDLLPGLHAVGHTLGRSAQQALLHCDGPPVLAILLGTPQGRWHAEFTSTARGARAAARLLCAANGVSVLFDATVDTPVALGMAVMLSWRFVHCAPGHEQPCAMMHAAQAASAAQSHEDLGASGLARYAFASARRPPGFAGAVGAYAS